jgi:hypothetical protein
MRTLIRHSLAGLMLVGLAGAATAANKELKNWPAGASPKEIGKKIATNMIPRWLYPGPGVHYAEDSTWYSALEFAKLTKDQALTDALIKRYDPWQTEEGQQKLVSWRRHVDTNIFGIVPLELYIRTKDPKYLVLGKKLADQQWENPTPDGLSPESRFWIDDAYMITILQVQAYRATRNKVYLDRAALEMAAYLNKLQKPNGLFFHGLEIPFYWGRGNGWVAGGMSELLTDLPKNHPQRAHHGGLPHDDGLAVEVSGCRRRLASTDRPPRKLPGEFRHRHVYLRHDHRREEGLAEGQGLCPRGAHGLAGDRQ